MTRYSKNMDDKKNVWYIFTIVSLLLCPGECLDTSKDSNPVNRRDKRNAQAPLGRNSLTDIIRHLDDDDNSLSQFNLHQYTPSTPSPDNVNCYVEVPVTRRVGGRCVSLGSNAMGCQAGVYLAFSHDCQQQQYVTPSTNVHDGRARLSRWHRRAVREAGPPRRNVP